MVGKPSFELTTLGSSSGKLKGRYNFPQIFGDIGRQSRAQQQIFVKVALGKLSLFVNHTLSVQALIRAIRVNRYGFVLVNQALVLPDSVFQVLFALRPLFASRRIVYFRIERRSCLVSCSESGSSDGC